MIDTQRTPFWRFSLRALLALIGIICAVAAVVRTHYRNVQRIDEIERCIAQAGSSSLCPELYSRWLHLREDFNLRVFLQANRSSPDMDWIQKAAAQIDARRQQQVELVGVIRGPRKTEPVDWAPFRQAIDCLQPRAVQFYGFEDQVPRELIDRLSCPLIDLGGPHLSVDGEVILTCDRIRLREGAADFWQHVSSASTVRVVEAKFLTNDEILSFQATPSLKEAHLDCNTQLTEREIRELMSHLPGVQVHLSCWGPSAAEQRNLDRDFAPYLNLEVYVATGPGSVGSD